MPPYSKSKKESLWNSPSPPDSCQPPQPLESQTFVLFIQRKRREGIHGRVGEPNWFVLLAVSAGVKMAFQHFQNICERDVGHILSQAFTESEDTDQEITGDPMGSEWVPDSICLTKVLPR